MDLELTPIVITCIPRFLEPYSEEIANAYSSAMLPQ